MKKKKRKKEKRNCTISDVLIEMVGLEVRQQPVNLHTAHHHRIRVAMSDFPWKERNQWLFRSVVGPAQHPRDVLDSDSLNMHRSQLEQQALRVNRTSARVHRGSVLLRIIEMHPEVRAHPRIPALVWPKICRDVRHRFCQFDEQRVE